LAKFYNIDPEVAQVPDRHEPDSGGEINYDHVFGVIRDSGYQGWIGLEYKPEARTEDGLAWMNKYAD
jgi:hydroxypyruvate isomerase